MKYEKRIPIFFTVDDNYIKYMCVTLASLVTHASKKYKYEIHVIYDQLSNESKKMVRVFRRKNISIGFTSVALKMQSLAIKLDVRDYYTLTTYYRLLLPEMFPLIKKAIYLDSDIVILEDIANFYNMELGDNLLGAVPDHSIQTFPEFGLYAETMFEEPKIKYINAGVIVMNFKEMRKVKFESQCINLLKKVTFKAAQDQDVLNFLCKGKIAYADAGWNVMPLGDEKDPNELKLVQYNLTLKPWKQNNIMYEKYFWKYAELAGLKDELLKTRSAIPADVMAKDLEGVQQVKDLCLYEAKRKDIYYKKIFAKAEKTKIDYDELYKNVLPSRKEVMKKIAALEESATFDQDVENDPPYSPIEPGEVDYLQKKFMSRFKSWTANRYSYEYFNHLIRRGRIVIDGYEGTEVIKNIRGGAIITANHFSPFDSIPVHKLVKRYGGTRKLFKIIKEGNYSYPGLYGFFMRHCNTLPLASNLDVLKEFLNAVNVILKRGDFILIYPEQSMWWNYRKPKPLKIGAFKFAANNGVPVIPTFITMRDTDKLDEDGLPIQAYAMHILEPIYPDKDLPLHEQAEDMLKRNEKAWKEIYEKVYGDKLHYTYEDKE